MKTDLKKAKTYLKAAGTQAVSNKVAHDWIISISASKLTLWTL